MASAKPTTGMEGARKRPFWTMQRKDHLTGLVFVAPQFIGIITFVFVPLVLVFYYSMHDWNVLAGTFTFVGSENYEELFRDRAMPGVLAATAIFSLGLVVLNISLALLLAVLVNQKLAGMSVFRTLFFSPVVVSVVAWAIVWRFLLQSNGGINGLLYMVGIEGPNWLRLPHTAMISLIVVQTFKSVGLNMVLFLAALQGVPRELHEAARVDGVPPFKQFYRITLPLISPTLMLVSIVTIVGALRPDRGAYPRRPGHIHDGAGLLLLPAGVPVPEFWLRLHPVDHTTRHRCPADLRSVAAPPEGCLL